MTTSTLASPTLTASVRVNRSLTAALERRALEALARRVPRAVNSDHLTALGLAAQIAAGCAYALARGQRLWLVGACVCLALNWLGDSLDGTLARVRNQQRPRYGFYVDHACDLLGTLAMLAGLALSGFVHPGVAAAMLLGFYLLAAESFLATHTLGRFELSQGGFGPTELRLLLVAANIALLRSPYVHAFGRRVLLFDLGGGIGAACMFGLALVLMVRHGAQLFREEPLA